MQFWKSFLLSLCVISSTHAGPVSSLVIFGDSLSDTGNSYSLSHHRLPAAPYYNGRFSNGPIWIDALPKLYTAKTSKTLRVLNYAFGGAGVLTMKDASFLLNQEIDSYLLSHTPVPADHVLIIWIGANDYLMTPEATKEDVSAIVKTIAKNVTRLVAHGAQHILMVSLPDLGTTPYARALEWETELTQLTAYHNQLLHDQFNQMKKHYPNIEWMYVDAAHLFSDIIRQPLRYGVTNTSEQCLGIAESKDDVATQCSHYIFFDSIHPTDVVQKLMAKYMVKSLLNTVKPSELK
jgi:phospholipase/lecithinase/hemolysin